MVQIGKYEIVRRTGHTPLGTLYEAFDPVMRRTVSIQAPEEEKGAEESRRQTCQLALQRGGESLGRLNHPNIRNIIATEEADGRLYLVMEHVHARPLPERIREEGLTQAEALRLLKMAALALDHAHTQGVLHPGLTTAHLLVDGAGLLKVAGFEMSGLQSSAEEDMSVEEADLLLKSVAYRSPEFLLGESVGPRSDQFSLAAIAFELLTGRMLFPYASPIATMSEMLSRSFRDLTIMETRLPSAVRRVFEKVLSGDPDARYASCAAMVEAMEAAVVRKPASATRVTDSPAYASAGMPKEAPSDGRSLAGLPIAGQLIEARRKVRRVQIVVAAACLATILVVTLILVQSRPGTVQKHNGTHSQAEHTLTPKPVGQTGASRQAPPQTQASPNSAAPTPGSEAQKEPDRDATAKQGAKKKRSKAADQLPEPIVNQ